MTERLTQRAPAPCDEGTSAGLWVVDPADPTRAHLVTSNPVPGPGMALGLGEIRVGGAAAWAIANGFVKPTTPASPFYPPGQLLHIDLRTGAMSTWFTAPDGTYLGILGMDAQGHPVLSLRAAPKLLKPAASPVVTAPAPLISAATSPPRVVIVTGPDQATPIAGGTDAVFQPVLAYGDSHGVWLSAPGSLWLFAKGQLVKVADVPASLFPAPTLPPSAVPGGYPAAALSLIYPKDVPLTFAGPCT